MAPKKEAKKESPSTSTHPPAIGTRTSPRTAKPKSDSGSDPQPPPVNVAPSSSGSGKAKLGSDPKPPKSKKVETKTSDGGGGESSSMVSKKRANSAPTVIVTRSSAQLRGKGKVDSNVPSDSVSQPPKSEKGEENASGSGKSSSLGSKKKGNTGGTAIVTQRSTRLQCGIGKVDCIVPPDSVSQPPNATAGGASSPATGADRRNEIPKSPVAQKPVLTPNSRSSSTKFSRTTSNKGNARVSGTAKKKLNMEPSSSSGRRDKGKAKMVLSDESSSSSEDTAVLATKKLPGMFKPVKITTSEVNAVLVTKKLPPKKRAIVVQPTSSVLTRQGKARLAKSTASTGGSSRRGKPKSDSDLTPPADPQPPKSDKVKPTASTSVSIRRGKAQMGSGPTPPAKGRASTSRSTSQSKAEMGSNSTPPADPEPPRSSSRGTTVEPSSRVLRSGKKN